MNPHLEVWSVDPAGFPADGFASDRLEFLLSYAILAPSPHNTQPWLFRINFSDVELHADPRRILLAQDPMGREAHLACGAALFNLRVAAEYFGQECMVELLPEPAWRWFLARLVLKSGAGETRSEEVVMFQALTERHTDRGPFGLEAVPEAVLAELVEAAQAEGAWMVVATDAGVRRAVADVVAEADRRQWANPGFRKGLSAWVRSDAEHQADGISNRELGIRDRMAFAGPSMVRAFNRGAREAARDWEKAAESPALVLIGTHEDDPASWLRAGQAMERVLLHATANRVSASPLASPLEVAELRGPVGEVLGVGGAPQVLLRMGYGMGGERTPRFGVHSRLIRQDPSKAPPH